MSKLKYCENCNLLLEAVHTKSYCPVCLTKVTKIHEIDEWIAPIIVKLNELGYHTIACCQGHYLDYKHGIHGGYILFDKVYDMIENQVNSSTYLQYEVMDIVNYGRCSRISPKDEFEVEGISSVSRFINELETMVRGLIP